MLANCMFLFALPIQHELMAPSTEKEVTNPNSILQIHKITTEEDDHQRAKRQIAFRPLFAYREQQAHNNHPVAHRRHYKTDDNRPIYNTHFQNAYSDVYSYYPYPV